MADAPPEEIPALATVDERVLYIKGLMVEDRWPVWPDTEAFRQKLAKAWGISEHTIRGYSAQASRLLRPGMEEREEIKQAVARRLLKHALDAEKMVSLTTGLPDRRSALDALDRFGRLTGIDMDGRGVKSGEAPTKIEIVHTDDGDDDVERADEGSGHTSDTTQ